MPIVTYPGAGCIVEYMESNIPQIALVTEEQGGKLRLLLPNRRETRLSINRLLPWSGPILNDISSKEKIILALEEHRKKRKELISQINIIEAWDMSQGEVEKAPATWFAELFEQEPSIDVVAAYGHSLLHCKSHFKFQNPHFEIYPASVVEARLTEQKNMREREILVAEGINFLRTLWDVWNKKRTLPFKTSDEYPKEYVELQLKEILLSRIADPESSEFDNIWRSLTKGLPDTNFLALHLATAWGIVPNHYNFWLSRADYLAGDEWSVKYQDEIEQILNKVSNASLTNTMPFISIDSSTTKDIDDAFFIEKKSDGSYSLHLALSCPALLWPFETAFDKVVMRRVTSLYLPEATYHMLPEILSTDALSLLANKIRPALCVQCDIDSEGALLCCTPSIQWVKISANLTYEDCEVLLDSSPNNNITNLASPYIEQLNLGKELSTLRQKTRIATGAVVMDRPDNKINLKDINSNVQVSLERVTPTPKAGLLVSEMMVLASTAMAIWGNEQNLPLLYRTQDVAIPKEYAGIWTEPHHIARIIRSLIPSSLELSPRPHAGLGVNMYMPITSPLRRYPDLINEAQVIHFILHGTPRFKMEYMEKMLPLLHVRIDLVSQVQRFRPRYWLLQYMRQEGDKKWWDAIITEENDNFATVSLPHEQLTIRGRRELFGERAYPGLEVQVRIGKVNPLYNEISLLEITDAR